MSRSLQSLPITLRQLQYLWAVAEFLSFRKAAEACRVSQPSLSVQVAEAESALGVMVFERARSGVRVTPAGEAVIAHANRVLLASEDLVQAARRHSNPFSGELRIGVIPTMGPYMLPEVDPAIRAAYPNLTLRWTEDRTESLVRRIDAGELDAALLAVVDDIAGLEYDVLADDAFVVALPHNHPLAARRAAIHVEDLAGHEVMLLDDGHCFRNQTLELCTHAGSLESGFRATSLATLVQMVGGGHAATLLPQMAVDVENRHKRLTIRSFGTHGPKRVVALAWRPRSPWAGPLRQVAEVARVAWRSRAR